MSCPSRTRRQYCAIEGSTAKLTFITDWSLCHNDNEVEFLLRKNILKADIINLYLHIYNATPKDEGYYKCFPRLGQTVVVLKVAKLGFIGQTDMKTVVGHEGREMTITCSSDNEQYITALTLESNNTTIAVGDNQTVDFKFIPNRNDHLSRYKCKDVIQSSITIEVELIVTYAPAITIRFTNDTIVCDCIGVPSVYKVYQINHVSQYGELLRSIDLNNETFTLQTEFPYQRNGKYECVVSPPVFSPENRNVKTAEIGQSMKLSFHIYSYPPVEEIFIEQIGRKQSKRKKINNVNMLTSILSYTEFANIVGIEGYEISVERKIFDKDDFQSYSITARNRLGESNYYFVIIDNESLPLSKNNRTYFVILCSVAVILIIYIIMSHVCFFVKHDRPISQRHNHISEDHNDQIYEVSSISFHNNASSSNTNNAHDQISTQARPFSSSNGVHQHESESFASVELSSDFQRTDAQEQRLSIASNNSRAFSIDVSGMISMGNAENCNKINANMMKKTQQ
ncbi:unnamed protein product [Mytilus coruscus]|uniref:Ig-like domain-containing protein n=1 Tax=Mytilus coruscus TaxID=42192 RepID=A0A6J8EN32_MYTCO|nr:unnamed protein product [Mytilus coruscus]